MPIDDQEPTAPDPFDPEETVASIPPTDDSHIIGPYRLRRQIGEGGMGEVWLAEQAEPIRRVVAVKIIKRGMDSKQVVARFEAERQALALMNHPHVAKVFDAGMTPRGRPYFAMEYIQGTPITDYCDRSRMTTHERLLLLQQVCEGVQHAHQKAIIHRDLKPSNVLVTAVDGNPVVKIIDFGVAKAIAQPLTDSTMFTQLGALIGTPAYMSPEQADPKADDIDTRADVYALGVILYELLVGVLPFEMKELRDAGFEGIRRKICEEDTPKPSARLSTLGDRSSSCAKSRKVDLHTLRRQLAGDLDWITLKALEKDRTKRYASPLDLAADLGRYLADEPVLATPPSQGYRLRKFIRRNRVLISSLSAVAIVLVLGIAGSTWGLVRALRAEGLAASEAAEARRQADIAEAVNDFLNDDLLAAASPASRAGRGIDMKMREVLDVAALRIEKASGADGRFADKPLVEAAIRNTLGKTYVNLAAYKLALPHYEREVELRLQNRGDRNVMTNSAIHDLGFTHYRMGDFVRAEAEIRRALQYESHATTAERQDIWAWKTSLAIIYENQARYAESEQLFLELLTEQKQFLGVEHIGTMRTMGGLASLYQQTDRFDECEALNKELLAIRRATAGDEDPGTLRILSNLANVTANQGRLHEALGYMTDVYELKVKILGSEHTHTLNSMNNIAEVNEMLGNWAEAKAWHGEALTLRTRVLGADHVATLSSMTRLAFVEAQLGKFTEAEPIIRRSVARHRAIRGVDHPETHETEMVLGVVLVGLGRPREAEISFRRLLDLPAVTGDVEIRSLVGAYLAIALAAQDRRPEAATIWLESIPALWLGEAATVDIASEAVAALEDWHAEEPGGGYAEVASRLRELLDAGPDF